MHCVDPKHGETLNRIHVPTRRFCRAYLFSRKHEGEERVAGVARAAFGALYAATQASLQDPARYLFCTTVLYTTVLYFTMLEEARHDGEERVAGVAWATFGALYSAAQASLQDPARCLHCSMQYCTLLYRTVLHTCALYYVVQHWTVLCVPSSIPVQASFLVVEHSGTARGDSLPYNGGPYSGRPCHVRGTPGESQGSIRWSRSRELLSVLSPGAGLFHLELLGPDVYGLDRGSA